MYSTQESKAKTFPVAIQILFFFKLKDECMLSWIELSPSDWPVAMPVRDVLN